MMRRTRWQEFLRRLAAAFSPEVRIGVWPVTADRRSQAVRDRDLETIWRGRVGANVRRRELAKQQAS